MRHHVQGPQHLSRKHHPDPAAVFDGTAPTGRRISTDYIYVMQLEDGKIAHMTKIWNAGLALKDLGWA